MAWFWGVLFVLAAGSFAVSFYNGRRQARRIGELTRDNEVKDETIKQLRESLHRASSADPTIGDILELFDGDAA